jgi:hypothetical protein
MTQEEIIEFNKRCAKFLGINSIESQGILYTHIPNVHNQQTKLKEGVNYKLLKFHSDWNWIKSVLEKISSLNEDDFSNETQQAFEDLLDLSLFQRIIKNQKESKKLNKLFKYE